VLDQVKKFANDPASVAVIEWGDPIDTTNTGSHWQDCKAVYLAYRARNQAGAMEATKHIFYLKDGKIIQDFESGGGVWAFELGTLYGNRF
jgi:hypothetical protein